MRRPAYGQPLSKAEHCSLSTQLAAGLAVGDQLRIYRNADEFGLYTIAEIRHEFDPSTVRMSKAGRERLAFDGAAFVGELDTKVAASELTDAEARAQGEFVERLVDDGVQSGLLVAAPHGGKIELNTDLQAEHITKMLTGVSSWICKGWRDPDRAYTRWHISSNDASPNSFAGLGAIADRGFKYAVSFHGMSVPGVIIGGGAPLELREIVRNAIIEAIVDPDVEVVVSPPHGPHAGAEPSNFVNWLTADGSGGIQIEQSTEVRNMYWATIADAVARVLAPLI